MLRRILYFVAVKRLILTPLVVCVLGVPLAAREQVQTPKPSVAPVASHATGLAPAAQAELVKTYCTGCHNDRSKAGELTLAGWDVTRASAQRDLTEKMIHKLRAGMMPPSGARRPAPAQLSQLVAALESRMDALAAADPNPGWRPFQRLNRAEYAREIRSLLDLDVDVTAFLPADTISDGFDNVADVQTFSPTLMEGYLRAASRIAMLAIGDPGRLGDTGDLQAAEDGIADGSRRGRAARHARRHLGRSHLRRRRRVRVQHGLLRGAARLPVRQHRGRARRSRCRSTARGSRCSPINPQMSEEKTGLTHQDARRFTSPPARIA